MKRARFTGLVLVTVFGSMLAASAKGCADDTGGGAPCQYGHVRCDGVCIDPLTNSQYCGAVVDCEGDNAGVAGGVGRRHQAPRAVQDGRQGGREGRQGRAPGRDARRPAGRREGLGRSVRGPVTATARRGRGQP